MCRFGDSGGYEPGNVFCGTPRDNYRDRLHHRNLDALAKANAAGGCFKGRRGDQHPASCAVMTSLGRFGSIALAADAYGMTRQRGRYRVVRGDWYMVPREA